MLARLLSIPADAPLYATSGFREWLAGEEAPWPPRPGGDRGLWLVDTRDRTALRELSAGGGVPAAFEGAVVLTRQREPGPFPKRLLRPLVRRYPRRMRTARVVREMTRAFPDVESRTFAFDDGPGLPAEFDARTPPDATGIALVAGPADPFSGGDWPALSAALGEPTLGVEGFQLRERGAAVALVRGRRAYVLRFVADPALQDVVERNHRTLVELRGRLGPRAAALLEKIPDPVYAERRDGTMVLGETRLPGALAWRARAGGTPADVLHHHAVGFLGQLEGATRGELTGPASDVASILRRDRDRLREAPFVSGAIREAVEAELAGAAAALGGWAGPGHASHGDFGYGNILVDAADGSLTGVIDWDTARLLDLPGIDRVNLEVQIARSDCGGSFLDAIRIVWEEERASDALRAAGPASRRRALFGVAICRYVLRSLSYPAVYRREAADFERGLRWLSGVTVADTAGEHGAGQA